VRHDVVFFDVGDTLWGWPSAITPAAVFQKVLESHGHHRSPEALEVADTATRRAFRGFMAPDLSAERAFFRRFDALFLEQLNIPVTDALVEALEGAFQNVDPRPFDDAVTVLGRLRREGFRLGVISNATHTLPGRLDRASLTPFFETVTDSWQVQAEKPDPRIFHAALDRAGVPASRAVHVGDNYEADFLGSRAVGMTPILIDRPGRHAGVDGIVVRHLSEIPDLVC
jgi:putative hydrolase of the HAD superfamily